MNVDRYLELCHEEIGSLRMQVRLAGDRIVELEREAAQSQTAPEPVYTPPDGQNGDGAGVGAVDVERPAEPVD